MVPASLHSRARRTPTASELSLRCHRFNSTEGSRSRISNRKVCSAAKQQRMCQRPLARSSRSSMNPTTSIFRPCISRLLGLGFELMQTSLHHPFRDRRPSFEKLLKAIALLKTNFAASINTQFRDILRHIDFEDRRTTFGRESRAFPAAYCSGVPTETNPPTDRSRIHSPDPILQVR